MPPKQSVNEQESTKLYKTHRSALVEYANGIVKDHACAEDVVQIAWERFYKTALNKTLDNPLSYFFRIVRNLCLDNIRARKSDKLRKSIELDGISEHLADSKPDAEARIMAREDLRILIESMQELPERSRLALTMHNVEGMKLREVAQKLGLSVSFTHKLIIEAKLHCAKKLSYRK